MVKKYLFRKKLKKRNKFLYFLYFLYFIYTGFVCIFFFFQIYFKYFLPEILPGFALSKEEILFFDQYSSILIVILLILNLIYSIYLTFENNFLNKDYDSLFVSLYKKLKTVDSLSQPERDELMESLYHEYQLAKQANNKVITQELPAFIKIENVIKDDVIRRTQKNIRDFNTQLKQQFNQLEKPVQDLINIEDYLLDINMKAKSIDDLEKHQQKLEYLFKQHQDKFNQKIISVKQKLLFKENIL